MRALAAGQRVLALLVRQLEHGAVIDRRLAAFPAKLLFRLQFFLGLKTRIKETVAPQSFDRTLVQRQALRLSDDVLPLDAEPA